MKPVVIKVFGDKTKKIEPESHRIIFPGGCISVERTTTGEYWAHIALNTKDRHEYQNGDFTETHRSSKLGRIVDSRIDYDFDEYSRRVDAGEPPMPRLPADEKAYHVAVKIEVEEHESS